MGIEYTAGDSGTVPSILENDDVPLPDGMVWYKSPTGEFTDWQYVFSVAGYPSFIVFGEPNSECAPQSCNWNIGDEYKMHEPQLPDTTGWLVVSTDYNKVADDWQCSESGPVKDIHFWGGWRVWPPPYLQGFDIKIFSDVQAGVDGPYSHPGDSLWGMTVTDFESTPKYSDTYMGDFDPTFPNGYRPPWAWHYYQYDICIDDSDNPFVQEQGSIYWLSITPHVAEGDTAWGWLTSTVHYQDTAAYEIAPGSGIWEMLRHPDPDSLNGLSMSFVITGEGGAEDTCMSGDVDGDGEVDVADLSYLYSYLDGTGNPPPIPATADLNGDGSIDRYDIIELVRWAIMEIPPSAACIPGSNPSVDTASLVCCMPNGTCTEDLVTCAFGNGTPQDLGETCNDPTIDCPRPPQACCLTDGTCVTVIPSDCIQMNGALQGVGTSCTTPQACCMPDGSCEMLDPMCCIDADGVSMGGTCGGELQACIMPRGECLGDMDPRCCIEYYGGSPQGTGTSCSDTGACCYDDGTCANFTWQECSLGSNQTFMGSGTECWGDGNQNGMDDVCEQELQACCKDDGSCTMLIETTCLAEEGMPMGPGTECGEPHACLMPWGDCMMIDTLCCIDHEGIIMYDEECSTPQACVLEGDCIGDMDPLVCISNGGIPQGPGTSCGVEGACCKLDGSCEVLTWQECPLDVGDFMGEGTTCADNNGNGKADECEGWQGHKMHYPQLPDEAGWDVLATAPAVMLAADDWQCGETGWIKDLHFWGSWKNGIEGQIVRFNVHIYPDVPAGQDKPYSHPDYYMLWDRQITEFTIVPVESSTSQGWYDPDTEEYLTDDHQDYFRYDITLNEEDWFWQEEGTIYWIAISAEVVDYENYQWGWKSSQDHFLDDAVWLSIPDGWVELYEPTDFTQSLDFAFVITGEPGLLGACCDDDGGCRLVDYGECKRTLDDFHGDGTSCLGDANSDGKDDACVPVDIGLVYIDVGLPGVEAPVDELEEGVEYEFRIWLQNSIEVFGLTLGFEVYTTDGATWTWSSQPNGWGQEGYQTGNRYTTIVEGSRLYKDENETVFDVFSAKEVNMNGVPNDSILLGGIITTVNPGIAVGPLEHMISVHFVAGPSGQNICFDSAFIPPAGWLVFADEVGTPNTPYFNSGVSCLPIVGCRDDDNDGICDLS
ncbi:MAG: dockerin type I repeat-containing protein, partial [Candidatus Zixiibacteriota bacterium]